MKMNQLGGYPVNTLRFDLGKRSNSLSYSRMLSDAQRERQTPAVHLYLPTENTLYSGGTGGQTVYAEYAAESTAEDPVVRIRGQSSSGAYDFTCRIQDINPEKASYAEMCALWGHLRKTGALSFQFGGEDRPVVPYGVNVGDITKKQDYMGLIGGMTTSQRFDQANQVSSKELLDLYQSFTGKASVSNAERTDPNAILPDDSTQVKLEKLKKLGENADYSGMSYVEIYREIYERYQKAFNGIMPAVGLVGGEEWGNIGNQFSEEINKAVRFPIYREIEAETGIRYGQQEFPAYWEEHYGKKIEAAAMGYEGMTTEEIEQAIIEKYAGKNTLFSFASMMGELFRTGVLDEKMGARAAFAYRGMVTRKISDAYFPYPHDVYITDAEWQDVMYQPFNARSFAQDMKDARSNMGFANWDFDIRGALDDGIGHLLAILDRQVELTTRRKESALLSEELFQLLV